MFVGHYGPSFLAKTAGPRIPLWILFLAVQLLDVLWAAFIFLGVEGVRIVPGFTKTNPLDLYYMPYTHSLLGALSWALGAGILYGVATSSRRDGFLVGAAVFSHWPLDLLVHRPDLALYDNTMKVGLGLWDFPYLTLMIEGLLLLGAMGIYMANSQPSRRRARYAMPVFCCAIFAMQVGMLYGPPPSSDRGMATTALVAYVLLAAAIAWLETGRDAVTVDSSDSEPASSDRHRSETPGAARLPNKDHRRSPMPVAESGRGASQDSP